MEDWRKLNGEYNRKQNESEEKIEKSHRAQEKIREAQERKQDKYWDPIRSKQRKTPEIEPPPKKKRKADVFQRVFQEIVLIIRELWLERNTDRHQPIKGQQRIARITEATRTVTELYSLQPLIMPEHESEYFYNAIGGDGGAIGTKNVGLGNTVENGNIPERL